MTLLCIIGCLTRIDAALTANTLIEVNHHRPIGLTAICPMRGGKRVTRYDKPIPQSIGGDESHAQPEGKAQEFTACQFTGWKGFFLYLCFILWHSYFAHCDLPRR